MIRFACPVCKTSLQSQDQDAGTKFPCPTCGQRLQVPAPPPSANKTVLGEPLPAPNKTILGNPEPDVRVAQVGGTAAPAARPGGGAFCPHCGGRMQIPAELAGRPVCCPHCGRGFRSPSPAGEGPFEGLGGEGTYEDLDEETRYRRERRAGEGASTAGSACSILSVIFGGIAFLLCPPLFGVAGLVLGIIGTVLSENKSLGVLGIVLSVVGTVVGMLLGAMLAFRL